MTDLDKLIAAVEAGECPWIDGAFGDSWFASDKMKLAQAAFSGSLNAALRLHEALLPGWEWGRTEGNIYVKDPGLGSRSTKWGGPNDIAARSWLLAILRALKTKGDA